MEEDGGISRRSAFWHGRGFHPEKQGCEKVYTHCTAAVLRGKDAVMNEAAALKENCQDIYEDANDINEKRYEEENKKKLEAARELVRQYEEKVNSGKATTAEG